VWKSVPSMVMVQSLPTSWAPNMLSNDLWSRGRRWQGQGCNDRCGKRKAISRPHFIYIS
jgi:hypothetical protein